ncbi:MAG TPA: hypothetical protein VNH44_03070 [Micropepsaceae bacterium]|nr:hypothetical protein [Micropepsaceae bacterium]
MGKLRNWLPALAAAAMLLFWALALTGSLPVPHSSNQVAVGGDAICTTRECREEATAKALADYTALLAWFTGVLALVSSVQGYFLWRADKAAAIAATASKEATTRSIDLAEKRFLLEGDRADTARREIGVLREQFYAAHRPNLGIRFIRRLPYAAGTSPDAQPIRVECSVINLGDSEARFLGGRVRLDWFYPTDIPNPDDLVGETITVRDRFAPSARDRFIATSSADAGWIDANSQAATEIGKELFLFGWVVYADGRGAEFGATRTTYFCLSFDPGTEQFRAVSWLPDWNFTS